MVDRTVYPSKAATPDLALRQLFGRHKTPPEVCQLFASNGLLSVETVAVLGESHDSVRQNFAILVGGEDSISTDARERALRLIQVITVWTSAQALSTCLSQRRAKMEEDPHKIPGIPQEDHGDFRACFRVAHPDAVLTHWNEPHRKFAERIHRHFILVFTQSEK